MSFNRPWLASWQQQVVYFELLVLPIYIIVPALHLGGQQFVFVLNPFCPWDPIAPPPSHVHASGVATYPTLCEPVACCHVAPSLCFLVNRLQRCFVNMIV